jgi:adenylate cyclase
MALELADGDAGWLAVECHGIPGQIQISDATHALLDGEFACTDRGLIDIKGKGPTRTWLLKSEVVPTPAR